MKSNLPNMPDDLRYCDKRSLAIVFDMPASAKTADELPPDGSDGWEPDLHFTGTTEPDEVKAIQSIITRYSGAISAYWLEPCFGICGTYSIELQFTDKDKMYACRKDYHSLFTYTGKLKKRKLKIAK